MTSVDLHLLSTITGSLTVLVVGEGVQETLTIPLDRRVEAAHDYWRRQFQAHHDRRRRSDASKPPVSTDAVAHASEQLQKELAKWFQQPPWQPLHRILDRDPAAPLRLQFDASARCLESLPWEILLPMRPTWRVASAHAKGASRTERWSRQPRVLLLEGHAQGLELEREIALFTQLSQRGRIDLLHLQQKESNHAHLRRALARACGWDVLIFLGHSEADPHSGGRFHLGDGSILTAESLRQELEQAARGGLHLVLLSSCEGIDLARSCVGAGVDWAFCFLDRVPDASAAQVFIALIQQLEKGRSLVAATAAVGEQLAASDRSGLRLLLANYSQPQAHPFQLPLSRRRQLVQRLRRTQRWQWIAAAAAVVAAVVLPIDPSNPLSTSLLDWRLDLQRPWRTLRAIPGPTGPALPVLLLDDRAYPAPSALFGSNSTQVSRAALATVLEKTPGRVRTVALDFALDGEEAGTTRLARVIERQRRPLVVAGYFGGACPAVVAGGANSELPPLLKRSGLQQRDLGTQIYASNTCGSVELEERRLVPLQLGPALTGEQLAGALSLVSHPTLPAHSVIDWSLDWFGEGGRPPLVVRVRSPQNLPQLNRSVLLVGKGILRFSPDTDSFRAPRAVEEALGRAWGGSSAELPGVVLQAVLAQSLTLNHWLTPLPYLLGVGLAGLSSAVGILLAAAIAQQRWRLLWLVAISVIAVPVAFELAVRQRLLVPIALPLVGMGATCLLRRESAWS